NRGRIAPNPAELPPPHVKLKTPRTRAIKLVAPSTSSRPALSVSVGQKQDRAERTGGSQPGSLLPSHAPGPLSARGRFPPALQPPSYRPVILGRRRSADGSQKNRARAQSFTSVDYRGKYRRQRTRTSVRNFSPNRNIGRIQRKNKKKITVAYMF